MSVKNYKKENGTLSLRYEVLTKDETEALIKETSVVFYNATGGRVTYAVEIPNITELTDGLSINVYFPVQSNTNCTLNVNSLGDKAIYLTVAGTRVTTNIPAASYVTLVYNAEHDYWVWVRAYDSGNSNTIGYQVRTNSQIWKNGASTAIYRYQILVETANGLEAFTSTSNKTTATKTQLSPKYVVGGTIRYYSTTTTINGGANIGATVLWQQYGGIRLEYSFNIVQADIVNNSDCYMKMSVNSDGTLSPVYSASSAGHPLVFELPTTADGYVYLFLGKTYTSSDVKYLELDLHHPIFEYKNNKIRLYKEPIASSEVISALGYTPANSANLGTAASKDTGTGSGNVPVLDSNGKLAESVLPSIAITDTFTAASDSAMTALSAQKGDICIRTDVNKTFILSATPATTLSNWKELKTPTDLVTSVAGRTGAVTLTASDVGLGNVLNKAITVTSTSVSDGTNTFNKFQHATYNTATASAVKVGRDSTGHVVLGDSLTASDVGALATGTTLDSISDGSTRKLANYLPKAGGTMTGQLKWNDSNALPRANYGSEAALEYILGIRAFSAGGGTLYEKKSEFLSGYATESWVENKGYLTSHQNISGKLDKLTYEWNKAINFGSSGYLKIGSFPMYDSNITINIDATTSKTYHGTVIIASQNATTSSMGSTHKVEVYDDPTGIIASSIRVVWTSGSRNYDVYFVPQAWSKNIVHIRASALNAAPVESEICKSMTGTAPTSTAGLEAVNILSSKTAVASGTEVSLVTTGEKATWNAKQNALSSQTAYSAKGSATKVPQITTNSLGQVTSITEVDITHPDISGKLDKTGGEMTGDLSLVDSALALTEDSADYVVLEKASSGGLSVAMADGSDTETYYLLQNDNDGIIHNIATQDWVTGQGYTNNVGTVTGIKIGTGNTLGPSNGTVTLPAYPSGNVLWNNGSTTWNNQNNVTCAEGSSNSEWSFDCDGTYENNMWHVWSKKNSKSILVCYPYNNKVAVPNGDLLVSGTISEGGTALANKYAAKSHSHSYSGLTSGYIYNAVLDVHPESSTTTIAYYTNDLVNLIAKGGSLTATNKTTGAVITSSTVNTNIRDNWLDGTPSYGSFSVSAVTDVVEIVIALPSGVSYSWSTHFGIGFGNKNWRAKDVKIESGRETDGTTTWKTVYNVTESGNPIHDVGNQNGPNGVSGNPWNRIRITLTNFNNTSPRIAQIWTQNYGSQGLALNFLQTKGGTMYGTIKTQTINPRVSNSYDLGSSTYQWNNLYAKTIYENGTALSSKYLALNGGTLTGTLTLKGTDIILGTGSDSSDDSGDIVYKYGNGQEKSRIWTDNSYTTSLGPNYRVFKSDGTQLYTGRLATVGEIPSVSDATITVKQAGRSDQTFTLNGSATTINLDNTTYSNATQSAAGLMSSTDKTRLDNIYTALNGTDSSKIDTIAEVYSFLDDYAQTTDLATQLATKVPTTRKVNNKALSEDISLTASDVGALPDNTTFVSSVNGSSGDITNIATTNTTQTISGAKTFTATDTIISGAGFSTTNNLLNNSSVYACMRGNNSNPLFGLKVGTAKYYLQATSSGLYLGPTSSVATSWDANGNITIRGSTQPKWGTKTLATTDQIPSVPTNVSSFTNDAGYLTSHQDISGKLDKSGDSMTGALSISVASTTPLEVKGTGNSQSSIKIWCNDNTHANYLGVNTSGQLVTYESSSWRPLATQNWVTGQGYLTAHQDISGKVDKVTSTDNAIVRFDGTTGAVQDSVPKIDDNGHITTTKSIVLQTIGSSISDANSSRLYFGTSTTNYYSYLGSNTVGAFSLGGPNGAFTLYPNTSNYNCLMANCKPDLGRNDTDGSKSFKNYYTTGDIYKHNGSNAYVKLTLPTTAGTLATQGWVEGKGYLTSHQDISGKLDKSGGTMTGNLTIDGYKVVLNSQSGESATFQDFQDGTLQIKLNDGTNNTNYYLENDKDSQIHYLATQDWVTGKGYLTAHPTITKSTDTTSTASPSHGGNFTVIDSITRDTNGHVTKINTKTVTLPTASSSTTKLYMHEVYLSFNSGYYCKFVFYSTSSNNVTMDFVAPMLHGVILSCINDNEGENSNWICIKDVRGSNNTYTAYFSYWNQYGSYNSYTGIHIDEEIISEI